MWDEWITSLLAGRRKKRIAKGEVVALFRSDGHGLQHRATTENVSDEGMRLVTEQVWNPGDLVVLNAPRMGRRIQARVFYCERLPDNRFAVGLALSTRVNDVTKSN
jgi:hypothetical protein